MNRVMMVVAVLGSALLASCVPPPQREVRPSVPVYVNSQQLVPRPAMAAPPPVYRPKRHPAPRPRR